MDFNLADLYKEVESAVATSHTSIEVDEGEHLYTNYQGVVAWTLRLQEIHNEIALQEILGNAPPELKKFRTMILDPSIERLEKVAVFESRRITARQIEANLDR